MKPNHRAALDAAISICLQIKRDWRGTSDHDRSV